MAVSELALAEEEAPEAETVRALIALNGWKNKDAARGIGMSAGSLSERLTGKVPWRAFEVTRLARALGVKREVLYVKPERLMERLATMPYKRQLRALPTPAKTKLSPPRYPLVTAVTDE